MSRAFTVLVLSAISVLAADAKDAMLSPGEIAQIKSICRHAIGVPFQDASLRNKLNLLPRHQTLRGSVSLGAGLPTVLLHTRRS